MKRRTSLLFILIFLLSCGYIFANNDKHDINKAASEAAKILKMIYFEKDIKGVAEQIPPERRQHSSLTEECKQIERTSTVFSDTIEEK